MEDSSADYIEDWMMTRSIWCPLTGEVLAINRDGASNAEFAAKIERTLSEEGWVLNDQGVLICTRKRELT